MFGGRQAGGLAPELVGVGGFSASQATSTLRAISRSCGCHGLARPHPSRPGRARERPVGAEHLPCLRRVIWTRPVAARYSTEAVPCAPGGRVRSLWRDPRRNGRGQVEPSYGRGVIGPGARSGFRQGHGVVSRRWWSSVVRAWISRVIWVFGAAAAESSTDTAPPPRPRPPPADQPNHRPVTRGSQPIRARGPADPTARSRLSLFDTSHPGLIGVGVVVRVVCRPRIAQHPAGQGVEGTTGTHRGGLFVGPPIAPTTEHPDQGAQRVQFGRAHLGLVHRGAGPQFTHSILYIDVSRLTPRR